MSNGVARSLGPVRRRKEGKGKGKNGLGLLLEPVEVEV